MSLVLDLWRETSRQLALPEAMRRLMPRLCQVLPLSMLLVRRLDIPAGHLETVACGSAWDGQGSLRIRSAGSDELLQGVACWCRGGPAISGRDTIGKAGLSLLIPEGLPGGDVATVPLHADCNEHDEPLLGALIAVAADRQSLTTKHLSILQEMAEPFAVALANDHLLRELRSLREAAEAENQALLTRLDRQAVSDAIIGATSGLKNVMERAELVAKSDVPVLILGQTGTGKEVVARAIHSGSRRAHGPMIRVNCGAIPPELVDSELFGHERGSFTGATATRKGWFERADGGTLFLDEIGELPLAAQVRLLRILQDGTFERVGGQSPLSVNVRLIAATHCDLHDMVRRRAFREDLWYRISVFPIHLPLLRERPEDIPVMATHFALKAAKRLGLAPALPTQQDLSLLLAYPWPGNVRELLSVIERAAILGNGRQLEIVKALGIGQTGPAVAIPPPAVSPQTGSQTSPARSPVTLDEAARQHIESALRTCHGRIEGPFGAAGMLGINPHTLRARMRKMGVDWKEFRS